MFINFFYFGPNRLIQSKGIQLAGPRPHQTNPLIHFNDDDRVRQPVRPTRIDGTVIHGPRKDSTFARTGPEDQLLAATTRTAKTRRMVNRTAGLTMLDVELTCGEMTIEIGVASIGIRNHPGGRVAHAASIPPSQNRDAAVAEIPPTRHQARLGSVDLGRAGFAPKLTSRLDHVIHPPHMTLGKQSAVGVHGHFTAQTRASTPNPLPRLTRPHNPKASS